MSPLSSSPPSPLSSSRLPASSVEYSKVRSTDIEDGSFEVENPQQKNYANSSSSSSSSSCFNGRCTGSMVACVAGTIAGTCVLLLFAIHVLTNSTNSAQNAGSNPNPSPQLSPNPSPIEASPPQSYSSAPLSPPPSPQSNVVLSLTALCNTTQDSAFCIKTLDSYPRSDAETVSLPDLTAYVVTDAMDVVNRTYVLGNELFQARNGSSGEIAVLQDCVEVLDAAMDGLKDSRDILTHLDVSSKVQVMNVRVWLSSAYTDQDTCWDEFGDVGGGQVADRMNEEGSDIAPLLSLALSFAVTVQHLSPSMVYIPLPPPDTSPAQPPSP